jgi:hypothetical protein
MVSERLFIIAVWRFMPAAKDLKKVVARRTIWKVLQQYINAMMGRFPPPEKLIERVEEKLTPAQAQAKQQQKS